MKKIFIAYVGVLTFMCIQNARAEVIDNSYAIFRYDSGNWSFSNGTFVDGKIPLCSTSSVVIIDDRNDLINVPNWSVNFADKPDGSSFVLCGTDVKSEYGTFTSFLNNYQFIKKDTPRQIKTATDKTLVIYDVSGNTPLLIYNPNTKYQKVMPSASEVAVLNFEDNVAKGISPSSSNVSVDAGKLSFVKATCGKIRNLKSAATMAKANTAVSAVGAASAIGSAVTSGLSGSKNFLGKQAGNADKTQKGLNVASTITASVAAATSTAGAVMAGMSIKQIEDVMKDIEDCKNAVNNL